MTSSKDDVMILIRELLDKANIREVTARYFFCLDSRDWEKLRSCFTPDASFERKALSQIRTGIVEIIKGAKQVEVYSATCHMMSSQSIDINNNHATTDTFATTTCVVGPIERGRILIRGLRYIDKFLRTLEGWRIQYRTHIPIWQYEVESVPPVSLIK